MRVDVCVGEWGAPAAHCGVAAARELLTTKCNGNAAMEDVRRVNGSLETLDVAGRVNGWLTITVGLPESAAASTGCVTHERTHEVWIGMADRGSVACACIRDPDGGACVSVEYFPEDEAADLRHIRSEILRYRSTDLMNDRERARFLGLPAGCRIRENAKILKPELFTCGENVWIGEGAILDAQGGLEIGDNTQIGLGVFVWSHTTHKQAIAGQTGRSKELIDYRPTRIGSNVFIAGPSVIGPGVTVGDGAIISPLSFVERDVEPGQIVSARRERREWVARIHELEREVAALREAVAALAE